MNTIRETFGNTRKCELVCFCFLIFSTFNINICCSKNASAGSVISSQDESDTVPHITDWRGSSLQADKLIDQKKFADAKIILTSILPHAKSEAPESVDYALTLCRLATDLYLMKDYKPALDKINEATGILSAKPPSVRQRKVTWRAMLTKIAILLAMGHNSEAEALARKTVAYAIAFPDAASNGKLKIAYSLLNDSLVKQKKVEEAKKVSEIMNSL
jgi:hypothetical protein